MFSLAIEDLYYRIIEESNTKKEVDGLKKEISELK